MKADIAHGHRNRIVKTLRGGQRLGGRGEGGKWEISVILSIIKMFF